MNPRDRLIAVLEKREPDCVPIVFQSVLSSRVSNGLMKMLGHRIGSGPTAVGGGLTYQTVKEFSDRIVQENPSNWREEYEEIANIIARASTNVGLYTKLGIDGFYYPPTSGRVKVLDKDRIVNEFGSISKFGDANGELIQWYDGGYLKTSEDRDRWELPLPSPERLKAFQGALKACGDNVYPIGFIVGIFELTWESMGFTEFARNLKANPDFIRRVYQEHAKFDEELAKLFMDAGAEVLAIGDDVAYKNHLMVSPKMWTEFVQPWVGNIVDSIHKRGGLVFMHSDGYVTPLLDLIAKTGYDGVQSLEPLAGVNLAEVKEEFGARLGLIGGIDTSQLLPFGTEKDVEKSVKDAIKAAGRGGGYAIGPCTEIHWECKAENVLALIKYAKKHGKYPLKL
jgi:hypothetical protein